ncbi:MAG: hypothetical protein K1X53_04525 [Candidatus Sumerlaeaceae bacterium]|nr:hypothetical protein [Candidatus Sumerlaeaceae bacterium]
MTIAPSYVIRFCAASALLVLVPIGVCNADQTSSTLATTTTATVRKTTNTIVGPARRDVPGTTASVGMGELYIPGFYDAANSTGTDIVVFFHGAAWCARQNFYDARKNAVLVSVSGGNYENTFRDPAAFAGILDETTRTLKRLGISEKPLGQICLASFSGGYSAVREILRQPQFARNITCVVLADSLYGPKSKSDPIRLDAEAIAPFLTFARRAASGETFFIFSHLHPPDPRHRSNTTEIAAATLIEAIGAERRDDHGRNSAGAEILYRADKGNFHVLGYSGMSNQDHFNHFYGLCDLLRETPLPPAGR